MHVEVSVPHCFQIKAGDVFVTEIECFVTAKVEGPRDECYVSDILSILVKDRNGDAELLDASNPGLNALAQGEVRNLLRDKDFEERAIERAIAEAS